MAVERRTDIRWKTIEVRLCSVDQREYEYRTALYRTAERVQRVSGIFNGTWLLSEAGL